MEASRKNSMNYGLILGILLIVLTTVVYSIDLSLFTSSWIGILNIVIITLFGVLATIKNKTNLDGFINFKSAFTSFFITVVLGAFISTVFSIILFNYVDPEAKAVITENIIKYTVEMMEKFGAKASDVNTMAAEMQKTDSFGALGQLKGFAFNTILYSIIGLIVALIIKKERPESIN